jgi:hypothetical protein
MTSRLKQVALSYATRRSLWLMAAFGAISIGPSAALLVVTSRPDAFKQSSVPFSVGFAAGICAWLLVTQAKWQFCDQRARMLPGFAGPHLFVLTLMAVLGMGAYPVAIASAGQLNTLGIAACSIGIGGAYVWAMHSMRFVFTALALVQFFSLMTPLGLAFWTGSRFAPLHTAILIAGWAALVAWLWRLATMREEDSDYLIPIQAQQGSATRMERTQSARTVARVMLRSAWQRLPADIWHDRLEGMRATTVAARKRLFRYGFAPTPIWINALFMALAFFLTLYFLPQIGVLHQRRANVGSLIGFLNVLIIMPAVMPGAMLATRRARMPQELLLPLPRREYFNGLFAATAWNAVAVWVPTHAAMVALVAIMFPDCFTAPFIAGLTALSLAVQVYGFGALTWIARKSSGGVRLVATMAVLIPALAAVGAGLPFLPRPDLTPAEIRQHVDEEFVNTYRAVINDLPPDEQARIKSQIRQSYRRSQRGPGPNPIVVWGIVAGLVATGAGCYLFSRNRWLELELG